MATAITGRLEITRIISHRFEPSRHDDSYEITTVAEVRDTETDETAVLHFWQSGYKRDVDEETYETDKPGLFAGVPHDTTQAALWDQLRAETGGSPEKYGPDPDETPDTPVALVVDDAGLAFV